MSSMPDSESWDEFASSEGPDDASAASEGDFEYYSEQEEYEYDDAVPETSGPESIQVRTRPGLTGLRV